MAFESAAAVVELVATCRHRLIAVKKPSPQGTATAVYQGGWAITDRDDVR